MICSEHVNVHADLLGRYHLENFLTSCFVELVIRHSTVAEIGRSPPLEDQDIAAGIIEDKTTRACEACGTSRKRHD